MPMKKGRSRKVMEQNFHEFRHGKTFARTRRKFRKKKANRQMIAAVLAASRKR